MLRLPRSQSDHGELGAAGDLDGGDGRHGDGGVRPSAKEGQKPEAHFTEHVQKNRVIRVKNWSVLTSKRRTCEVLFPAEEKRGVSDYETPAFVVGSKREAGLAHCCCETTPRRIQQANGRRTLKWLRWKRGLPALQTCCYVHEASLQVGARRRGRGDALFAGVCCTMNAP